MMNRRDQSPPPLATCEWTAAQLAPYCAGELEAGKTEQVDIHLECCPACRAELAREQDLRNTLSHLPLVECPARVTAAILEETQFDGAPPAPAVRVSLARQWTSYLGWAAAAAAAFLIVWSTDRPVEKSGQGNFTAQEITTARQEARASLLLTATILNRTERSTVKEVFGQTLPASLSRSIKTIMTSPEGGQG